MKLLRYLVVTAALGLAVTASASGARANNDPYVPLNPALATSPTLGQAIFANHNGSVPGHRFGQFFHNRHQPKLPVFQAAPWYNYWPYDGHFLTPAPINGQFYGPPMTGNFPVNPYFPGPGIPSGFGTMPGGPPPLGGLMAPPGR